MLEKWQILENYVKKQYNGKKVPMSGAGVFKEDVEGAGYLFQCKHTNKKSYSINIKDLETLELNSAKRALNPAMFIRLFDKKNYIIIPEKEFNYLLGERNQQS